MPEEIHLSHNKFTAEGYNYLFEVLEEKRKHGCKQETNSLPAPTWLRVEGGYIDKEMLNDLEAEGRICFRDKLMDTRYLGNNTVVVAMLAFTGGYANGDSNRSSQSAADQASEKASPKRKGSPAIVDRNDKLQANELREYNVYLE